MNQGIFEGKNGDGITKGGDVVAMFTIVYLPKIWEATFRRDDLGVRSVRSLDGLKKG